MIVIAVLAVCPFAKTPNPRTAAVTRVMVVFKVNSSYPASKRTESMGSKTSLRKIDDGSMNLRDEVAALEHHDGNDDCDDPVAEGFEAAFRE